MEGMEVFTNMQDWAEIRFRVLRQGVSKRTILRETGMHHATLKKILENPAPPGYRQSAVRVAPKLGPHVEWVTALLKADQSVHKKQRHTAHRIFQRLREERGYTGGETVVKDLVRELARVSGEVFMPLSQRPGEAQVDFFEALVRYPLTLRVSKVHIFAMHLPYSDMFFLKAYERENTEVFQDGHVSAFEFFGGVPSRISYDNLKIAVSKIIGSHARELAPRFLELRSHYLFDSHFCNVRSGNEKGCVEGLAKYARRNFLVPVPQVVDIAELNVRFADACKRDGLRRLRGKDKIKMELLPEEKLSPLPITPFEACKKVSVRATSLSLIRFDNNDYSVPVANAHHQLVAKGFADYVFIFKTSGEEIAHHVRSWGKEGVFYDFRHYLPLLESKPGALDHAAPFADLVLPDCFDDLRRRLESGYGHKGTKDYIRVLMLLEKRPILQVAKAIEKGLAVCQRPTVEVIRSYLYGDEHPEAQVFRLDNRPQLAGVRVALPDLSRYGELLQGEGQA
jgi:transposase